MIDPVPGCYGARARTFNINDRAMRRIGAMLAEPGWPILVIQEGGYALRNLRTGATEFFRGLTGQG